ncbi:MAG TPA: 2Fe-2S iron-sulfur cluster-binding protein [Azospirillum sp.]
MTFSSPALHRDVTVYAVAGDNKTLLAVAEKNDVKIPHDCRDGECSSCLVEVTYLAGKPKMAIDLTEKEKTLLHSMGKLSAKEIEEAEVNHTAPHFRLACQCIVRDEDILVRFTGEPGGA